jgi:hypothetical protein
MRVALALGPCVLNDEGDRAILGNLSMGVYFRTDINRLSFGELWRISSRPSGFFRACVNKIFRIPWPVRTAVLHEERIAVVPAEEIPAAAWRELEPMVADLEEQGARLAFYQTVPALGNLQGYAAVLLPREQNAVIMVNWVRVRLTARGKETIGCAVTSELEDGTFFSTTNHRRRFDMPPEYKAQRWLYAPPSQLLERHQNAVANSASPPLPVPDAEHARDMLVRIKCRTFEWHRDRGVWVPLTAEQLHGLGLPPDYD